MNKLPIDVRGLDVRLPQDLKDWRPAFPEPREATQTAPIGERKARIAVVAALCAVFAGWLVIPPMVEKRAEHTPLVQPAAERVHCDESRPGRQVVRVVIYDAEHRPLSTHCLAVRAPRYVRSSVEVTQ